MGVTPLRVTVSEDYYHACGGRIRLWIIAASLAGLAALAVVSWLSYRSTKDLIAANQRLARAHKLIEDLTELHLLLDDAESSCRGYALTGKEDYLTPYEAALAQLDITTLDCSNPASAIIENDFRHSGIAHTARG